MSKEIIIKKLKMQALGNRERNIRVFLPKDYFESKKKYPVLYMHDGQNLVNKSELSGFSWEVKATMDRLHQQTKGVIIVGIDHGETKRIMEYSNYLSEYANKYLASVGEENPKPEAEGYGRFILEQVKPFIDGNYRTLSDRANTFIAGSSCGANISLFLGFKYPDVFSVVGAFSPAFEVVGNAIFELIEKTETADLFVYHDIGTKEAKFPRKLLMLSKLGRFNKLLLNKLSRNNVLRVVDRGATHSELYWQKRFGKFLLFCLAKTGNLDLTKK